MPDWNGLGFQQLAAQGVQGKLNRQASAWQQVIDAWMKTLDQYQQQDYTINKLMPAQEASGLRDLAARFNYGQQETAANQQNALELQTGQQRFAAGESFSAAQRDAAQKAQDRAAEDARYAKYNLTAEDQKAQNVAQLSAQDKAKQEPWDFWTPFMNAAHGSGNQGIAPDGSFDSSLVSDPAKLRRSFATGVNNNPALMAAFDAFMAAPAQGAPTPTPLPDPQKAAGDLANKIGIGAVLAGTIATPILNIAATLLAGAVGGTPLLALLPVATGVLLGIIAKNNLQDKIDDIRNWANGISPGLGDKIFSSQAPSVPQFGAGTRPATAGSTYQSGSQGRRY